MESRNRALMTELRYENKTLSQPRRGSDVNIKTDLKVMVDEVVLRMGSSGVLFKIKTNIRIP
jgi:hypothetical protein